MQIRCFCIYVSLGDIRDQLWKDTMKEFQFAGVQGMTSSVSSAMWTAQGQHSYNLVGFE